MREPDPGPKITKQMIRYVVVAGLVALGYLVLVAAGIQLRLHYFVAILIAQAITIAVAFPIYRRFVFESRGSLWADFLRFIAVWSSGAIAGILVTPLLVELLAWDPLVAQILAVGVVSVASFLGHRFFSFRRR